MPLPVTVPGSTRRYIGAEDLDTRLARIRSKLLEAEVQNRPVEATLAAAKTSESRVTMTTDKPSAAESRIQGFAPYDDSPGTEAQCSGF